MKLELIRNRNLPGPVFLKVKGTEDEFICKFYEGYDMLAQLFKIWIELDTERIFAQGIRDPMGEKEPEDGSLTL